MSYERFAYFYDYLMQDVPYDDWVTYVTRQADTYSIKGKDVLDIACGTGELSLRLIHNGYNVTGVDISEEMLLIAQEKATREGTCTYFVPAGYV